MKKRTPFHFKFSCDSKVSYETNSKIGSVIVTSYTLSLTHTHTWQYILSWIKWLASAIVAFQSKSVGVQA